MCRPVLAICLLSLQNDVEKDARFMGPKKVNALAASKGICPNLGLLDSSPCSLYWVLSSSFQVQGHILFMSYVISGKKHNLIATTTAAQVSLNPDCHYHALHLCFRRCVSTPSHNAVPSASVMGSRFIESHLYTHVWGFLAVLILNWAISPLCHARATGHKRKPMRTHSSQEQHLTMPLYSVLPG